jgi:hypothetical protein
MKVLVIIISHEMRTTDLPNIEILNNYMKDSGNIVEYGIVSSTNDFSNYEGILNFKYKLICPNRQLTKLCKFITTFRDEFDYDWYIKIRPDIRLLEQIVFPGLDRHAINARAREYEGPFYVTNGLSIPFINGIQPVKYNPVEISIVLDDQVFIFHNTIINNFSEFNSSSLQHEWVHTAYWKSHNIGLKIIGLDVLFTKYNWQTSDLSPKRIGFYTSGNLINNVPSTLRLARV